MDSAVITSRYMRRTFGYFPTELNEGPVWDLYVEAEHRVSGFLHAKNITGRNFRPMMTMLADFCRDEGEMLMSYIVSRQIDAKAMLGSVLACGLFIQSIVMAKLGQQGFRHKSDGADGSKGPRGGQKKRQRQDDVVDEQK